jgi:hypothetical protein
MTWETIEGASPEAKKQKAKAQEKITEIIRAYHRCFNTEDGQKVLEDLTRRFLLDNSTSLSSQNVAYEAAYHNGEAGVIRLIIHYIQQAERE